MLPDYGTEHLKRYKSSAEILLFGVRYDYISNYGRWREVNGVIYTDDHPNGMMLTIATYQTLSFLTKLLREQRGYQILLSALVGPRVVGGGGNNEQYNLLCGKICLAGPGADDPPSRLELKHILTNITGDLLMPGDRDLVHVRLWELGPKKTDKIYAERTTSEEILHVAQSLTGLADPGETMLNEVRLMMPKPPTKGFLFGEEASELIKILQSDNTDKNKQEKLRKIGEEIYLNAGFKAMQATAREVRWQFPDGELIDVEDDFSSEGWHPQTIDWAWDGIGPWRP